MPGEAYVDTAFLFRLYWDEAGSEAVRRFAATCGNLVCSMHGRAEFHSTAHRKFREGAAREELDALLAQFELDVREGGIVWLPVAPEVLERVEDVFRSAPREAFLRAADALHLASASAAGHRDIYSNDRQLLAAAPLFGLEGVDLTDGEVGK